MRSTKKSLLMSVLSLMLCVAMLLGTTFAWFTDSVTSGKNTITAGNLDIELEYYDAKSDTPSWKPVTNTTSLFDDNALWEPGYTEVAYLRLSNKGTLALKYNLAINVYSEKAGTNVAGENFKLSDYIHMGVDESWNGTVYADRAAARAAVGESGVISAYTKAGSMLPGDASTKTFAIVVYMPEDVGNEANYKTGTTAPEIEMGVEVAATQLTSESDSFDNKYDVDAPWMGEVGELPAAGENGEYVINTAAELAAVAYAVNNGTTLTGKTVKLGKDIDLNNKPWTPINTNNKALTFDGNNKTILNLNVPTGRNIGLFGVATGATIKNVKINHATVTGYAWAGTICGQMLDGSISGCEVNDATVIAAPEWDAANKGYKDGSKAGGIIGYQSYQNNSPVTDCKVTNSTIKAYRDLGGVVGFAQGTAPVITGCTVDHVNLEYIVVTPYETWDGSAPNGNLGDIYGRKSGTPVVTGSSATNITKTELVSVGTAADLKTALEQFTGGTTVVLEQDIDLKNENWDITTPWGASGTNVVFDGNGHTIKNLKTTGDNGGLFGKFNSNGSITIKNLILDNVNLVGTNKDGESGGGALIGWSENYGNCSLTIDNVSAKNVKIKDFKYIGGLVGYTSSTGTLNITNCSVNGAELNSTYCEDGDNYKGHVGGFVGLYTKGTISNCTASNLTVLGSTTANRAGALIGTAQAGVVLGTGNSIHTVTINGSAVTAATQVIGSVDNRTDKSEVSVTID